VSVSPAEVRRVAELARLGLTPAEVERLTAELNRVLEHVDALGEVEVEAGTARRDVPDDPDSTPATQPSPLRPDDPGPDPLAAPPGSMAPAWADGFFTVPRLASHRGGPGGADTGEATGAATGGPDPESDR
jgi:aspartyl-tRNA(Asn)/glutamyl-tRNA(Gln) amidotransferase subunit C